MKFTVIATATLAGAAMANPVAWNPVSPRAMVEARADADHMLAARSISNNGAEFAKQTYDYVVVGAGTAGLAVAARLSQNGQYTVGVIEAGGSGFNVSIIDTPGLFGADLGTVYDWNYTTVAQSNGVPSSGWPRGKVLGGSSALNFLVWDRSSKYEIDAWEQLGNPGWNWNNLYAAMKKSEKFTAPSAENAKALGITPVASNYGSSGPIQVSYPRFISESVKRWIPALTGLGIPLNNEPLGGENVNAAQHPSDINPKNSTRSYSAPAYLFPNQARKNLKVLTNALATKINFTKTWSGSQKATSVSIKTSAGNFDIKVNKEVIVSGGAVNTPQLLELSGIGNKNILSPLGINTLIDLPGVGENLQDHTYSAVVYEVKKGQLTLDSLRDPTILAQQQALYAAGKPSLLDETVPSIGYLPLERVAGKDRAAKLIAEVSDYVAKSTSPYKATLQKQLEFLTKYPSKVGQMEMIGVDGYFAGTGAPQPGSSYFTVLAANQHEFSRGNIHVKSKDASVYPAINANYFDVPFDLEVATAGTEYARKVAQSQGYSDIVVGGEYWPGNSVDIKNYTKTTSVTEYHPIGTASMLPKDKGGVVDSNLKVYGTSNVRVVDASIMPLHVTAHIQATIYGVAEYAAQLIQKSW